MGFFSKLFGGKQSDGAAASKAQPQIRDEISGTTRTLELDGVRISLDMTAQKLSFESPPSWRDERKAPLLPVLEATHEQFASAACLVQKAKQIDDGVFAALEIASQEGVHDRLGKRALLERLAAEIAPDAPKGLAPLLAAARIGGVAVDLDGPIAQGVEDVIAEFEQDPKRSKPLGFYTWSEALSQIFRQDRLLQTELSDRVSIERLASSLAANGDLAKGYLDWLQSVQHLTNPWPKEMHDLGAWIRAKAEGGSLDELPDKEVRFLPPSQSPETELIKRMFRSSSIPEGFDLANEVVDRIRAGTLSLTPGQSSGYYARQLWALEPLLLTDRMPEAHRFRCDDEYRRYQKELFKAAMALSRETHVTQLEMAAAGCAPPGEKKTITVAPSVSVEPFASFYKRRADSYAFLRGMIEQGFGSRAAKEMHRLTPEGRSERTVAEELESIEAIFRGAAARALSELGEGGGGNDGAFDAFVGSLGSDPDLSRDARMMVPVFFDVERKKTKVWAFLGWRKVDLSVGYEDVPTVRVTDAEGRDAHDRVEVEFDSTRRTLFVPVARELYVEELLDRDQMRKLCDKEQSEEKIIAALS